MKFFCVLTSVIALGLLTGCGKSALETKKAEITAQGGVWTLEELGVSPEEEKNDAFDQFVEVSDKLNDLFSEVTSETGQFETSTDRFGEYIHVTRGRPERFGFKQDMTWDESQEAWSPVEKLWDEVVVLFEKEAPMYSAAYKKGAGAALPYLPRILTLAKCARELALFDIHSGELDAALDRIEFIRHQVRKVAGERAYTLIDSLILITVDGILMDPSRQIIDHPEVSHSHLIRLEAIWGKPDALKNFGDGMEGERVIFGGWIWEIARKQSRQMVGVFDYAGDGHYSNGSNLIWMVYAPLVYCPFLVNKDELFSVEYKWAMESGARKIRNDEHAYKNVAPSLERYESSISEKSTWVYPVSQLSLPAISGAMERAMSLEVLQRQLHIALQLKKQSLKGSPLPEAMEDAVLDPIDLQPMRYRKINDDQYVLYSMGINVVDDSGEKTLREVKGRKVKEHDAPDWLWPRPSEPEKN